MSDEWREVLVRRNRTSKTRRLYVDGCPTNRYSWDGIVGTSLHYEEDGWVDVDPCIVPSEEPGWDWEMSKSHWRLLVKNGGWFAAEKQGVGIGFRLGHIAYLNIATKEYTIIREASYGTPTVEEVHHGNDLLANPTGKLTWGSLFPGVDFEIHVSGDRLHEEIIVSQAARDAMPAPPYPAADTYLVMVYEMGWGQVPGLADDEGDIDYDTDFERATRLYLKNHQGEIIAALPVSKAWAEQDTNSIVPLRKRFIKRGDKHYLLVGAPVLALNALSEGTIIFDPDIDVSVDAGEDDGYFRADGGAFNNNGEFLYHGYGASRYMCFARFDNISDLAGKTIDVAYCELKTNSLNIAVKVDIRAADSESPTAPADANACLNDSRTSAKIDWDHTTPSSSIYYETDSIVSVIQELATAYDPAAILIYFDCDASDSGNISWLSFEGADPPKIHIEYSAGGTTYYSTPSGSQTNTGALLRKIVASRAGALTFAGNMLSAVGKMFAGAVTTAGTLTEKVAIVLSGALSSIGTLTRKIPKVLIGAASLGGILARKTSKVFAGAASFIGSMAKKTIRSLTGESTSSGAVSALGRLVKLLAGTLTSAGALTSRVRKILAGASDLAGAVIRAVMNKLAGGLTGSGVLTKKMARSFTGTLTSAGNLAKRVATFLTGALTGDGILTGRARKVLDGALTSIGALTGKARKVLTGALASVGTLGRKAAHALSGALFLDGSIIKKVSSRLAGVLNLSGITVKSMLESLMGAVAPGGTLSTKGRKLLAGVATSAGMITKSVAHRLAGGLTLSGTIIKGATQFLTGAITIAGDQVKKVAKSLAGEAVSLGILAAKVWKVLTGTLMTAGSLVGALAGVVYVALAGTLASTGALVRKTVMQLAGIFTPGGALTKYVLNLLRTWKLKAGKRLTSAGANHNWDMPRENRETREEDL